MNEDIRCPKCDKECENADSESYGDDMTYQNENYCDNCEIDFSAVYKFDHIVWDKEQ